MLFKHFWIDNKTCIVNYKSYIGTRIWNDKIKIYFFYQAKILILLVFEFDFLDSFNLLLLELGFVVLNELSVLYFVLDWIGTNLEEVAVIEVELNGAELIDDGNSVLFLFIAEKLDFIVVDRDLCWFCDGDKDWLFDDDDEDDGDDDDNEARLGTEETFVACTLWLLLNSDCDWCCCHWIINELITGSLAWVAPIL